MHIQYSDITADGNYDFVNETLVVTDTIWCNYIHFTKITYDQGKR